VLKIRKNGNATGKILKESKRHPWAFEENFKFSDEKRIQGSIYTVVVISSENE